MEENETRSEAREPTDLPNGKAAPQEAWTADN